MLVRAAGFVNGPATSAAPDVKNRRCAWDRAARKRGKRPPQMARSAVSEGLVAGRGSPRDTAAPVAYLNTRCTGPPDGGR